MHEQIKLFIVGCWLLMAQYQTYFCFMRTVFILSITLFAFWACQSIGSQPKQLAQTQSKQLIDECLKAHGWSGNRNKAFEFDFRNITYRFSHDSSGFVYEREGVLKGDSIHDVLENEKLSRRLSGELIQLSEEEKFKYAESVNSVIYFATLPLKLNDPAVRSKYLGLDTIQNIGYELLKITFGQENGGVDFEDEFLYWINPISHEIDFLAYNYQVNGGGVRFRTAFNKRRVSEVLFQDYINFKAPKGTDLTVLAKMWENNQLDSLSSIELERIGQIAND